MTILAITGVLMTSPSAPARLMAGPEEMDGPEIAELIARADLICCGRIVGAKAAEVVGDPKIWIAARFVVDRTIKGLCPTNEILILTGNTKDQKVPDNFQQIIDQLDRESRNKHHDLGRLLVFLKQKDVKKCQFELVEENAGIKVGPIPPSEDKDSTTEARIETELKRGLEQLEISEQAQIKEALEKWKSERHGSSNGPEIIKNGSK